MKSVLRTGAFGLLLACGVWCLSGRSCSADEKPLPVTVRLDTSKTIANHGSLLLGNNVQWVDSADGLYDPASDSFNEGMMTFLRTLRIGALRFPGGSQADAYHWEDGVGERERRKPGLHVYSGEKQPSYFGTDEFLRLCRELRAEPVMTVNIHSGTAEEAARWVRYCKNQKITPVRFWEIGNEPYLVEPSEHNNFHRGYDEIFARKFIEFAEKMKKEDPSIQVGLPLQGRTPKSDYYKDWNSKVWPACAPYADFVSIHHAYYPVIQRKEDFSDPESFVSLMAASQDVRRDTEQMKKYLHDTYPGKQVPLAVTEYNCFFALPGHSFSKYTASLSGALYVASVLADFYQDPGILMANFWSLTRNWLFGATNFSDQPRPQGHVLKVFSDYTADSVIESEVRNNPVFENRAAGYVTQNHTNPVLSALATKDDKAVYLILINRSPTEDVPVSLEWTSPEKTQARIAQGHVVTGASMSATNEGSMDVTLSEVDLSRYQDLSSFAVPKHSVLGLKIIYE